MFKESRIYLIFFFSIFVSSTLFLNGQTKKLEYSVDVTGKSLNFRVLHDGKFVDGLLKENFDLYVGGVKTKIEDLTIHKKKIKVESKNQLANRRLFVLIFNISDHRIDLQGNIEYFFRNILKKGDRIIFISNSFFLNDRLILDVKKERKKIFSLIELEKKKIRTEISIVRAYLSRILKETFEYFDGEKILLGRRYFIENYIKYLKEFKRNYLNLDTAQYIKLTQYLSNISIDKWVLCFYHIGGFYRPGKNVENLVKVDPMYMELLTNLDMVSKLPSRDLSKYFVKSGATLHSIFMKNSEFPSITYNTGRFLIKSDISDPILFVSSNVIYNISLKYNKIATNSENYFSLATKMSGGMEFSSRKTKNFFSKIMHIEDVMYTITFDVPNKGSSIKLVPKQKKFKVIFDNQKFSKYMKDQLLKNKESNLPQVQIQNLKFQNKVLKISVINYKMEKRDKQFIGELDVNLKVLKSNKVLFSRKKKFTPLENDFELNIRMSKLKKDHFIIVDVKDLKTGKNDIAVLKR